METSYKEKYEQALAHAREIHRNEEEKRSDMEWLFPELKESGDEKVRKALIDFFSKGAKYGGQTNGVYDKDIIAWLEKQGKTSPVLSNSSNIGKVEQNPNWSKEDENMLNNCITAIVYPEYFSHSFKDEMEDWLKSIKERIGGKI